MHAYLKALNAEVFSLASLVAFYPLARRRLDILPALLTLLLLATGLWFLHFSPTPWPAINSVLAAILAAYVVDIALARRQSWTFVLLGVVVAFGAYGYFAGRTLVFVVAAVYAMAIFTRERDPWVLTRGFVASGLVAFVLFAPQMKTFLENWEYVNTRPRAASCSMLKANTWAIHQPVRSSFIKL